MRCNIKINLDYLKYCFDCDGIKHEFSLRRKQVIINGMWNGKWSTAEPPSISDLSYNETHLSSELVSIALKTSTMRFYDMTNDIGNKDHITIYD